MNSRKSKKLAALVITTLALTAGTYAFAAANTVPDTNAGDGSGAISGYTITNVAYDINSDTDPTDVDSVDIDVVADNAGVDPSAVYVKVDSLSATYTSCVAGASPTWTCTFADGTTVASADELRVIAVD